VTIIQHSDEPLRIYLRLIKEYLDQDGVNELSINRPHEFFLEKSGQIERHTTEELSYDELHSLAILVASYNDQEISHERPLLSGILPDGERVQIVLPPACESGTIIFSIRKPFVLNFSLNDYSKQGAFDEVIFDKDDFNTDDIHLLELKESGNIQAFISQAVKYKKNIIISGGTSSGKTTLLNAMIKEISCEERLITIEDTREVKIENPNKVHLLYSKGGQGVAKVTANDLLQVCLRLRPDRILLSEIRGTEAFDYLRTINSGHPGSITSLHADSARSAFEQLILMVMQTGVNLGREQITAYLRSVVDVIIQFKRINGIRKVTEIYYEPKKQTIQ